jgi:predicted enzyme related to lactoylglutathione lyase
MGSALIEVVIDCRDPRRVAGFWADVLGWHLTEEPEGFCWLSATGEYTPNQTMLTFAPVGEDKTVKNRLHLDVSPSGCDQAEELERLLALGAQRADVGQGEVPWIVLTDPEGNEFCLLGRRIDPA